MTEVTEIDTFYTLMNEDLSSYIYIGPWGLSSNTGFTTTKQPRASAIRRGKDAYKKLKTAADNRVAGRTNKLKEEIERYKNCVQNTSDCIRDPDGSMDQDYLARELANYLSRLNKTEERLDEWLAKDVYYVIVKTTTEAISG